MNDKRFERPCRAFDHRLASFNQIEHIDPAVCVVLNRLREPVAAGALDGRGEGLGVRADAGEAVAWYSKAARAGDAKARWNLALCYRDGDGVARSRSRCRYWLQRAARQGHAEARRLLRECEALPSLAGRDSDRRN